ncbi:phosphatidylinositol-glycan biosynthesis class X protein [Sitodiplosis mosellana]|uniref:phosphatidylinositol-glycan biosynthesis class X protein n=1 Tax=Sitodiplosis mosellana TaxID=263140 RepID=UPI0024452300|nr:phosphatidylinositol-glycan biosynthesis class X protein [Sitodiplosis mosellana]
MNNTNRLLFATVIFACYSFCRAENAKLTAELMNSGFHRHVEYIVVFPDYQGKQHSFLIKQLLPASVYVDTDQLDDLNRFNKLNYFVDKSLIDVEKPTEKSEPFNIHLFGNTAFLQTISLPIHFRYHAPGNKSFVTVNIAYPELYVEVDDDLPVTNASKPVWMLCKDLRHRCQYVQVEYDNFSRRPMTASIPIGNANMSGTVTVFTIALSWIACIYLIFVIRKRYFAIRHKLEPNRTFNQKQK